MQVEQRFWTGTDGWSPAPTQPPLSDATVVFAFGDVDAMADPVLLADVRRFYPDAQIIGCSTSGEILQHEVRDGTLVLTAVRFDYTHAHIASVALSGVSDGRDAAARLIEALPSDGLRHIFVLTDGLHVNGSDVAEGLAAGLPDGVHASGGLAADGGRFTETLLWANDLVAEPGIVAVGFYGDRLHIGCAAGGGWSTFGAFRRITRAEGNVLYELDGVPALESYKSYLGRHAASLPDVGLRFPLALRGPSDGTEIVRSVLSVDEADQSITFAGNVPEGAITQFMKTNSDNLIDGAADAGRRSAKPMPTDVPALALLVSCVGRRWLLDDLAGEEVEAVHDEFPTATWIGGFYSYGEIAPLERITRCSLHNQTMTITTFAEA